MQSYMLKVLRVGEPECSIKIDDPHTASRYWNRVIKTQTWFDKDKEHLVVLLLSTKYHVQGYSLVSIGSLSESIAHPREIFRAAIASGCCAIVVLHNHPSGDPSPSQIDRGLTERLLAASELLQIRLLDHVIVGRKARLGGSPSVKVLRAKRNTKHARDRGYFSFKEAGVL